MVDHAIYINITKCFCLECLTVDSKISAGKQLKLAGWFLTVAFIL